jgi:hypothetical protein
MTGSKHSAPPTGYHGLPPEALIAQYREIWAKQLPPEPTPLKQHPFIKLAEGFFGPLSLIKVAGPKV